MESCGVELLKLQLPLLEEPRLRFSDISEQKKQINCLTFQTPVPPPELGPGNLDFKSSTRVALMQLC